LRKIRNDLSKPDDSTTLYALVENGYVFLRVIYDDGRIQQEMDRLYGPKIVKVSSALWPVT
jgi:hypothetical protein